MKYPKTGTIRLCLQFRMRQELRRKPHVQGHRRLNGQVPRVVKEFLRPQEENGVFFTGGVNRIQALGESFIFHVPLLRREEDGKI
jgi:hypothetical protein